MIKFDNENLFFLFLLIPAAVMFYFYVFRWKKNAMAKFGNIDLVRKLSASVSRKRQNFKAMLIILGLAFILLALVRPQIGTKLEEVKREGLDIFIALDVSKSMLAEDIKPNRLAKAKHEISSFINLLKGDRIGLVAFAGEAFVQCPLTLDYGAAKIFLDIMESDLIPEPGTNLTEAISVAMRSFEGKERKYKVLVLITDGEDHGDDVLDITKAAAQEGVIIYTVGIGSPMGVPIPQYDRFGNKDFKKDRAGNVILTKLDHITLEKIALSSGGKYYQSVTGETRLEQIYDEISLMEKKELASMKFSQYEDRFQVFVAIALFLLLIELFISERVKMKTEWRGRFE